VRVQCPCELARIAWVATRGSIMVLNTRGSVEVLMVMKHNQKDTSCSSLYNTYVVRLILGREPPFLCTEIVSFACCLVRHWVSLDCVLIRVCFVSLFCVSRSYTETCLFSIVIGQGQERGGTQARGIHNNSSFASHSVISRVTSHNPLMYLVTIV
jgi:hypothetical protein